MLVSKIYFLQGLTCGITRLLIRHVKPTDSTLINIKIIEMCCNVEIIISIYFLANMKLIQYYGLYAQNEITLNKSL